MSFIKRGRPSTRPRYRVEGLDEIQKNWHELAKFVATDKERQSILTAAATPVVAQAKRYIKESDQEHYYYYRKRKTTIVPGNLKKSFRFFRNKTNGNVSIGPQFLKRSPAVMGTSIKAASGYYAAAVYQKAAQFRKQVTEKALTAATAKSLKRMDKRLEKILKKYE